MTLWQEYVAGTDPSDAFSFLKVDSLSVSDATTLSFIAVSNRTYTVEFNDDLGRLPWTRLADVVAAPLTRLQTVADPVRATNRLYRLVTPRQP